MIAIQIKLAFDCEECKQPIPLGGLVERPRCDKCQSTAKPDWKKLLNFGNPSINVVEWAKRGGPKTEKGAFGSIHLDVTRTPIKHGCGAELDADVIAGVAGVAGASVAGVAGAGVAGVAGAGVAGVPGAGGQTACAQCKQAIAVRPCPPFVGKFHGGIACVVGETQITEDNGEVVTAKPIMFACMNCGAPLRVDGTNRIVDCGSCDVPNFIPDALWLRLHPAKKREPFWLVIR